LAITSPISKSLDNIHAGLAGFVDGSLLWLTDPGCRPDVSSCKTP
jgi:hypothetical protein